MPYRVHVLKVPTTVRGNDWRRDHLFPYTHYADEGHDPYLQADVVSGVLRLTCEDLFKLKPNRQRTPLNRIDLYMPGTAAQALGVEIVGLFGPGDLADLADVSPETFRRGPQTLPRIREARRVAHRGAGIRIAGHRVSSSAGAVYIDNEAPNDGHIEMLGPEVHLGVPLRNIEGMRDDALVEEVPIPDGELRVKHGERNPFPKSRGIVTVLLDTQNARAFAATLLHYAAAQGR